MKLLRRTVNTAKMPRISVDLIKQYADIDELTQALLNTLIERIEVHEPEDVDGERIRKT